MTCNAPSPPTKKDTSRCPFLLAKIKQIDLNSSDGGAGLERDRRLGRIKGVRQGRKQGVRKASPVERMRTTMFSSGKKTIEYRFLRSETAGSKEYGEPSVSEASRRRQTTMRRWRDRAQAPPGADEASATREKTRSMRREPVIESDDYVFEWEEERRSLSILSHHLRQKNDRF